MVTDTWYSLEEVTIPRRKGLGSGNHTESQLCASHENAGWFHDTCKPFTLYRQHHPSKDKLGQSVDFMCFLQMPHCVEHATKSLGFSKAPALALFTLGRGFAVHHENKHLSESCWLIPQWERTVTKEGTLSDCQGGWLWSQKRTDTRIYCWQVFSSMFYVSQQNSQPMSLIWSREHRCWSRIDYNQTHYTCAVFLSEFQTSQIRCLWVNLFTLSLKPGTKSPCCLLVLKIQVKRMFLFDSWLNCSGDRHLPNLQWHHWALPPVPSLSPCSVLPSSLINQAYI